MGVLVGWVLFYFTDLGRAFGFMGIMFGTARHALSNTQFSITFINNAVFFAAAIIGCTPFARKANELILKVAPIAIEFYNVDKFKDITSPQKNTILTVNSYFNGNIIPVDAYTPLSQHTGEYLYFRTDHHWTALGAYYAYTGLMKAMGEEPVPLDKYETAKIEGFLGSTYQSTLSRTLKLNPDTITIYKPFIPHEYTIYYEGPLKMNLIDMNRVKDQNKYRVFMSGDRPWSRIVTNVKNGRKIAVVKDSFGNAFIPFLLPHFEEIFTVDPRQYTGNILSLINDKGIRNVLFLNYVNVLGMQSFLDRINEMTER